MNLYKEEVIQPEDSVIVILCNIVSVSKNGRLYFLANKSPKLDFPMPDIPIKQIRLYFMILL